MAFDGNRYSVPRAFAFGLVTVKGYVDRVVIVAGGQVVATHARSLEKTEDDPRPAPFPGDAGPQARRAGPRPGLPRLEAAGLLRRVPGRAGATARHAGRRPPVRPGPATAGRAPPGARDQGHRGPVARVTRQGRGGDPADRRWRRSRPRSAQSVRHPNVHHPSGRCAAARPEPVQPAPGRPATRARSVCSSPDRGPRFLPRTRPSGPGRSSVH